MQFKFNIPTKITIIRVCLIPLFLAILLAEIPYKNFLAAFIFCMLSISDFLDGYFARKKKQVTEFGKLIDPIADKLLISSALIFLTGKGIPLWMTVTIISREVIVTAIRIYLLPSKIVVPASNFGKAKTIVQSIAIMTVLLKLSFSYYIMFASVLLTVISGIEYLIRIRNMTADKIVNLPNLITASRFLLIIPFAYYLINKKISISILFFAIIILSDKLDGISARLMNQKTELGSGLDSFTDWSLILITFTILVVQGQIGILWVIVLAIPAICSGILKVTHAKKKKVVPVTFAARLSVGLTYTTIISILFDYNYSLYLLAATIISVYLALIAYIFKILILPRKQKR